MKLVDNICPEDKQEFDHVCLACNTVAWRMNEISDIKRQLIFFFSLACNESTDTSDTVHSLIFFRGVDDDVNIVRAA